MHDLNENALFLKRKLLVPLEFSFGSPEYEIGFCNKTVNVSFLFFSNFNLIFRKANDCRNLQRWPERSLVCSVALWQWLLWK